MNDEYSALAKRVRESLADLERAVSRAEELQDKAVNTGDDGYWDGVALNLHSVYSAIERILVDIAQAIDGVVPAGSGWHRQLLMQMSDAMPDLRPAVVAPDARQCLDEYLGFRHMVRNAYTFNLRPARLQELVAELRPCLDAVTRDLTAFADFLDNAARTIADEG